MLLLHSLHLLAFHKQGGSPKPCAFGVQTAVVVYLQPCPHECQGVGRKLGDGGRNHAGTQDQDGRRLLVAVHVQQVLFEDFKDGNVHPCVGQNTQLHKKS